MNVGKSFLKPRFLALSFAKHLRFDSFLLFFPLFLGNALNSFLFIKVLGPFFGVWKTRGGGQRSLQWIVIRAQRQFQCCLDYGK